jgi:hypothetical protein
MGPWPRNRRPVGLERLAQPEVRVPDRVEP